MPTTQAPAPEADTPKTVRLHITPLKPELLKVYLAPSVLPLARNVSYHTVHTFPEKGYGYVELPEQEAQKIRKKLNGTTLKGSKVRIEMAKPEKRKVREEADAAPEDKPSKRAKKEKKDKSERRKRDPGVFDGVELPDDRKVKRGWTEPASAKSRSKDKKDKKSKDDKHQPKPSKYTKEPELLFKAKLEPVAATEHSRREKKKDKKEKKERKTRTKEVIVHEFEKNTKTPSFLKVAKVSTEKKPPVEYVNGLGWVDEDGAVVEPETKKAAHSRVLQLVDGQQLVEPPPTDSQGRPIVRPAPPPTDSQGRPLKPAKKQKPNKATPPPESDAESDAESSVVSSSSEDEPESESDSESESEDDDKDKDDGASPTPSPVQSKSVPKTSQPTSEPSPAPTSAESKQVHPLEALFKRAPPTSLSTPTKPPPINTSFSFFDNETTSPSAPAASTETTEGAPTTPFTQRDLEWRGLRSSAPTPDTAAIGRRFSFHWRKGSHEADEASDEEISDVDAGEQAQLDLNTRANTQSKTLADVAEEEEENAAVDVAVDDKPESEFRKWFWENRGDINRAWKKRRREALKAKRHADNRKMTGGRQVR
ncbi:uncharacterized protein EKO05_0004692 [Ascochyta rabiei]|uniref:uncharacterized protein n=1 Tax=Didymella rabiei TaxID=5454 RepID=UPI00190052DA|nr:uncharacterized protein EKO05_0004692 [Ascochyta rabiei]UPX14202.1 hypothetical protein EKO05_0004692 [Ascochyta rabiei]